MSDQQNGPRGLASFDLSGKVALITGSSRGIGRSLADALASAGAAIILNGRATEPLEAAQTELAQAGTTVYAFGGDVTDSGQVDALFARVDDEVGQLDIVVNNAGIQFRADFVDFPVAEMRRLFDTNLLAPTMVAQAAAKRMVPAGAGKIINIASVQARLGRASITPYAATKGGIAMLTRGLCADLAPSGIQVNAIAPGYFATELTQNLVDDADFTAWLEARTPARRWGDVAELAGAAIFLASDASNFVNGQILFVDGGMTAVV